MMQDIGGMTACASMNWQYFSLGTLHLRPHKELMIHLVWNCNSYTWLRVINSLHFLSSDSFDLCFLLESVAASASSLLRKS